MKIIRFFPIVCLFLFSLVFSGFEQENILNLQNYLNLSQDTTNDLLGIITRENYKEEVYFKASKIPEIFKNYSKLKNKISFIELGQWPTKLTKLNKFSSKFNVNLFAKCDNIYGNKIRKLEFLLADAINNKFDTVLTFGCAGSNHCALTAYYSKILGLKSILMLKPQHNSNLVRNNLLRNLDSGAKIIYSQTSDFRAYNTVRQMIESQQNFKKMPYVIPTGGSCPLGILGYVNAIFELKSQIDQNIMPIPDKIYLPLGSAGTFVGILLGLKAAKLKTKVYGIAVEPEESCDEFLIKIKDLFYKTNILLNSLDSSFDLFDLNLEDFEINRNFSGSDYALFTKEGVGSMKILKDLENINLDGVYSAKAFAALVDDIEKNNIKKEEIVLFWNTFYFNDIQTNLDYKNLPKPLHRYFEENVQKLDICYN